MGNTWTTTFDATTYQVAVPDGGGLAMKKNCASRTSPISGKCRRFEGQDLVERVALRALIDRLLDYHVPERCEEGPLTWIHMPSATGGVPFLLMVSHDVPARCCWVKWLRQIHTRAVNVQRRPFLS